MSPNIDANYKNHTWLSKPAILAAKHKDTDNLNAEIQSQTNGQIHLFKSIDSIIQMKSSIIKLNS